MSKKVYMCNDWSDIPKQSKIIYQESINSGSDIVNWGVDNKYPSYLNTLISKSPIHNSIVYLKIKMISSYGLISADWKDETLLFIKNNSGSSSDSLNLEQIIKKIASDLVVFGGFALNIRWNKEKTRIAEINFVPLEYLRIQNPSKGNGFYIGDWTDKKSDKIYYPKFDIRDRSKESSIFLYKEERTTNYFYPVPEYDAAIELLEINAKIVEYQNATITNQFNPLLHISYPANAMTDEEKEETVKGLIHEYRGQLKSGMPMFSFPNTPEDKVIIEAIPTSDADTKYLQMWELVRDGIVSAHQIQDKRLASIEIPGNLAGKNDLIGAFEAFQVAYVSDKQNQIQNMINYFGRINMVPDKLTLETYKTNLKPDLPISELISLISSTLTNEQKVQILITKGFSRNEAVSLIGINISNPDMGENKTTTN